MKIVTIMLLMLVGCASGDKKSKSLTELKNEDFAKPVVINYLAKQDFYTLNKTDNSILAKENLNFANKSDQSTILKDDLFAKAVNDCESGKIEEGLNLLLTQADQLQKNPIYWNSIGLCYLANQEYKKALMFFNRSLDVNPGYVPALNNLGVLLANDGEEQKALAAFKDAASKSLYSIIPKLNLAQMHLKYFQYDQAISILASLYKMNPRDLVVANAFAFALVVKGDYVNAVTVYENIAGDDLRHAEVGLNYVVSLLAKGDKKTAKKAFNKIKVNDEYRFYYDEVKSWL
jgi:tetratricopeptide (TPR) repeat protein